MQQVDNEIRIIIDHSMRSTQNAEENRDKVQTKARWMETIDAEQITISCRTGDA